ncbi:hypothetical protein CFO_g2311 [Ceratocystis platani]|uniref:Uncharacterized protein n=1 Tax=Ceratocystis fimbriata f. sp. platani TaxID=88771 RepID=A0A0F8B1Z1_CERFI|nr:hypothetical protein CFO_g2311 [Ceratocystis platani]
MASSKAKNAILFEKIIDDGRQRRQSQDLAQVILTSKRNGPGVAKPLKNRYVLYIQVHRVSVLSFHFGSQLSWNRPSPEPTFSCLPHISTRCKGFSYCWTSKDHLYSAKE